MGLLRFIRRPIFSRVGQIVRDAVVDTAAAAGGDTLARKALATFIGSIVMVATGAAIPDDVLQLVVQAIVGILTWLGVYGFSNGPRNPPPISQ